MSRNGNIFNLVAWRRELGVRGGWRHALKLCGPGLMATAMPGTRQWRASLEHKVERWCQRVAYTGC